ncbi:MAG: AAA family ATPase [Alkalibacterium sp.]|nr:AAA family ATPase [Alkalibacterium sp.]
MPFYQETHLSIEKLHTLIDTVDRIVIGKKDVTRLTIVAMLAGGHVLFEDIPGVGKTLLIRTIAKCLDADFARIQFTPDLIPSDIIGFSVPDADGTLFNFRKGPIFNQLLLADEINRTSPRTQAAMLEAMSEKQVTLDGRTHRLPNPFLSWPRRTRSNIKGLTLFRKLSWTVFFFSCLSVTRMPSRKSRCWRHLISRKKYKS